MKFCSLILGCLAAALSWSMPAAAQTLTDSQILQQFNAVIFENFSTTADVEGRTVIGGNLNDGATFALNPTAAAASEFAALTVYGNENSGNSLNVVHAGGVAIAGNNAGTFNMSDGGSVFVGGNNTGSLSTNGSGAGISVVGSNGGQISLSDGGSVTIGSSNSGQITINGGSTATDSVAINGKNTGSLTLNSGGSIKINGNTGNGSLNGGSLTYTGSKGSWNLNGGATATHVASLTLPPPSNALPSFASTFQAPLTALSKQLAALTPNSTVLISGNNITLEAHPNAKGQAVLDLSTSVFQPNDSVSVALNGATSFIINMSVAGCSSNCSYTFPNSVNFKNPTSYADSLLWNVTDVSALSFTNEFGGTVLAPSAVVTNSSPLDGSVVALSLNSTGELHEYPFTGALPTPEPSSLAVLSVAVLGIGLLRQRRQPAL